MSTLSRNPLQEVRHDNRSKVEVECTLEGGKASKSHVANPHEKPTRARSAEEQIKALQQDVSAFDIELPRTVIGPDASQLQRSQARIARRDETISNLLKTQKTTNPTVNGKNTEELERRLQDLIQRYQETKSKVRIPCAPPSV
jgi:hypothetical protein